MIAVTRDIFLQATVLLSLLPLPFAVCSSKHARDRRQPVNESCCVFLLPLKVALKPTAFTSKTRRAKVLYKQKIEDARRAELALIARMKICRRVRHKLSSLQSAQKSISRQNVIRLSQVACESKCKLNQ